MVTYQKLQRLKMMSTSLDSLLTYVTSIPGSIINHVHIIRPELYKYCMVPL